MTHLSVSRVLELAEALAKTNTKPHLPMAILDARAGDRAALAYLRGCVTPLESIPTPGWVEDGPCAGYGCDAIYID